MHKERFHISLFSFHDYFMCFQYGGWMLELYAAAITAGAIAYKNLHAGLLAIGEVSIIGSIAIGIWSRTKRGMLFGCMLGGCFVLGAGALWHADRPAARAIFGDRTFDATVLSVDRRLMQTNIIVRDRLLREKLQLSLGAHTTALPGDMLRVRASIDAPESFITANGRLFDYPHYLESKGIVGIGKHATARTIRSGRWSLARISTVIRFRIADTYARYVAFPVDGVIAGMTVGYQGGIPQSIQDLFRSTGVLHVLVLSGYNVTLLAGFLALLLKRLPFRLRTMLTIAAIVLLVTVSGSGVASVRAGIMGSIGLIAGLSLRTYRPLRALTISYLLFFFLSPLMAFYDPGFHLSFLATAFMLFGLPKIERVFRWIPKTAGIDARELLMLAVSAPVFMLPYTMYFSGNFPLSSPIANIVLAIATPPISVAAFLLLAVSWLPPLAYLLGGVISWFGMGILRILEWCGRMPIWNAPPLAWWAVLAFYVVLYVLLFRIELRQYCLQLRNSFRRASSSSD